MVIVGWLTVLIGVIVVLSPGHRIALGSGHRMMMIVITRVLVSALPLIFPPKS